MKKSKIIKIVISVVVLIAVACVGVYFAISNDVKGVTQSTTTVELGSKNFDCLKTLSCKDAVTCKVDSGKLNTNKLGTYKYEITATNKYGFTQDYEFSYSVIDTTAPKVKLSENIIIITEGDSVNLRKYCQYSDCDKKTNLTISKLDTKDVGMHDIKFTAQDSSGNKTTKEMSVSVHRKDTPDIKNVRWGDTIEQVKNYEGADYGVGKIGILDFDVSYTMTKSTHTLGSVCFFSYFTTNTNMSTDAKRFYVYQQLLKKYGTPEYTTDFYSNTYPQSASWNCGRTRIYASFSSSSGGNIDMLVSYDLVNSATDLDFSSTYY